MTEHVPPPPPHAPLMSGEVTRHPETSFLRVLFTVTGLLIAKAILFTVMRYLLAFRVKGTAAVAGNLLTVTEEWWVFGRSVRRRVTTAPVRDIAAVRFEKRQRYLYLLVGFGGLVVGTLLGVHWFLDGLRAGYPYLTLVGAFVVLAGIVLDAALYLFVPAKGGRSYLIVAQGPWSIRFRGVDTAAAEAVIEGVHRAWSGTPPKRV